MGYELSLSKTKEFNENDPFFCGWATQSAFSELFPHGGADEWIELDEATVKNLMVLKYNLEQNEVFMIAKILDVVDNGLYFEFLNSEKNEIGAKIAIALSFEVCPEAYDWYLEIGASSLYDFLCALSKLSNNGKETVYAYESY